MRRKPSVKTGEHVGVIPDTGALNQLWNESPALIKRYFNEYPNYRQLCREVVYILQKELKNAGIKYSGTTYRVKTLESIIEKAFRKTCEHPFEEITDIAGIRLVHLYRDDFEAIEKILQSAFEIVEKVDTIEEQGVDRFGYSAVHFQLKLGKKSSGARYDDLKNYICELQVRTVLQDAWALISHHLVYKHELDIPSQLRRNLNAMAGSLESADTLFVGIKDERDVYLKNLKNMRIKQFLRQEINYDTVNAYLEERFPNKLNSPTATHHVLQRLRREKFKKISDLHRALSNTEKARSAYINSLQQKDRVTAQGELFLALAFCDAQFCLQGKVPWDDLPNNIMELIRRYRDLVICDPSSVTDDRRR